MTKFEEISAKVEVGVGATQYGYSDSHPYEIVGFTKSKKTLKVRQMDAVAKHTSEDLDWHVGGFSAHAASQHKQEWELTSNPENPIEEARWSNAKGGFYMWNGQRELKVGVARKFYDYNF